MRKGLYTLIRNCGETLRKAEDHIDPVIEFETKKHYEGPELVYVISEHKIPLQTLTGSKTLTPRHVEALKKLGFSFKSKEKTL